jgi:peroxiredoxin
MADVGEHAPDFTLPDAAGQVRHLADALAAGPVLLAFFKADCGACNLAFPYVERMRQAYPGDNWSLWGVSQNPVRAAEWFAKNTGVTFPLVIDDEGFPVSCAYDPPATPTLYLIDRDGTIVASHYGMSKDQLNTMAAQLAGLIGAEPAIVAPPDDGKPSFRPG